MGYLPLDSNTLTLYIGTVYGGTIAAGSNALNCASASAFRPTDVGLPISLIGSGTMYENMYILTDPVGSLWVTTIASYVDAHNVTLTDPVQAYPVARSVTVENNNVTVYRPVHCVSGSIQYNSALTARDTASFSLQVDASEPNLAGNYIPIVGQPVYLKSSWGEEGDIFGGTIDQVKVTNTPGSSIVTVECQCLSWDFLLTKRLVTSYNSTYTSQALGLMANALVYNHAGSEGIAVYASPTFGPTIDFESFTEGDTVSSALDQLCSDAFGISGAYYWYIDPWKHLYVVAESTNTAPWNISDLDTSDGNVLIDVSATTSREKMANRVYVSASKQLTAAATETYTGDGSRRDFTMTAQVGLVPAILVNGNSESVGIDGTDSGFAFYWSQGSNSIRQDDTVVPAGGHNPLTSSDTLVVTYQGITTAIGFNENFTAVDARAGVEGGTGYWDVNVTIDTVVQVGDAATIAETESGTWGALPVAVEIQSYRGGLKPAQLIAIHLADIGISGSFLIDSVSLSTEDNHPLWKSHAVNGPLIGDWRTAMINLAGVQTLSGGGGLAPTAQPSGGGSVAPPNASSATCVVTGIPWANSVAALFSGVVDFSTTVLLKYVAVSVIDPSGQLYEIARYESPFGGFLAYSGYTSSILLTDTAQTGFSIQFACYDANYNQAASPLTLTGITIPALAPASVTAQDNPVLRWRTPNNEALHSVLSFVPVQSGPFTQTQATVWENRSDYAGTIWHGWEFMSAEGQTLYIGCPTTILGSPSDLVSEYNAYVPTMGEIYASTTVGATATLTIAFGAINKEDPIPASAVTSAPFAIDIAPCLATDIQDQAITGLQYDQDGGGIWHWDIVGITFTEPSKAVDPNYWGNFMTIQKGYFSGGTWYPAPVTATDDEGGSDDSDLAIGRVLIEFNGNEDNIGSSVVNWIGSMADFPMKMPTQFNLDGSANIYNQYRLLHYCVSRLGTDSGAGYGSCTLQTSAFGGTGYLVVTPTQQTAALDLRQSNLHSIGSNATIDPTGKFNPLQAVGSNELINGGFEQGMAGWQQNTGGGATSVWSASAVSNHTVIGAYSAYMSPNPGTGGYSFLTQAMVIKPSDCLAASAWFGPNASGSGTPLVQVYLFDTTGAYLSTNVAYGAVSAVWTKVSVLSDAAPSNVGFAYVQVGIVGPATGTWYVDDVTAVRVVGGQNGTTPTVDGGYAAKLAALGGLQFDSYGNTVTNLGYTMRLNSTGGIDLSNLPTSYGLPTLPAAAYPQGAVILNTADYKVYRNTTGSAWVKSTDPADLVAGAIATGVTIAATSITAGTLAVGVLYAGSIAASQITGGTVTATIAFTGASLQVISGGTTVSINDTDFIKVSTSSGFSQLKSDSVSVQSGAGIVNLVATGSSQTLTIRPITSPTASAGSATLPSAPSGFLAWQIGLTTVHVPYYN